MPEITMHSCTGISITSFHPDNNNAMMLTVKSRDGSMKLALYGLPDDTCTALIAGLDWDNTKFVFMNGDHGVVDYSTYRVLKRTFDAMEGKSSDEQNQNYSAQFTGPEF